MIHYMKSAVGPIVKTRCGLTVKKNEATVWETDVRCENCLLKPTPTQCKNPQQSAKVITHREKSQDTQTQKETEMSKVLDMDESLVENVTKLRDDEGKKWDEIVEATGVSSGKCMLAYSYGKVAKKDRIKNATAEDVIRLRGQSLSWGEISVRCGLSESSCRSLFEKETGASTKGNRIGKGGRYPSGAEATPRTPRTKAAKAEKAAKPAAPAHDLFADVEYEAIPEMLTGFAIMVDLGNGEKETIKVKSVKKAAAGKVILVDGTTGQARTIKLAAISKVSTKKVK